MHRRVLSLFVVLLLSAGFLFAQTEEEDDSWFYDKPVSKIEFEGLQNVKKTDLNGITSAYIDDLFTDEMYSDLLDRLYALDLFEDINPYAKHDEKDSSKVWLVFQVTERPVIKKVTFEGNKKIRNGELRDQIKIKSTDIYVESKVLMDERIIRNYYIEKGYTNSTVSHTQEVMDDGIYITFHIHEGSNTVIKEIHFTGNSIVSEKMLKSKLSLKEVGFLKDGFYQASTLEQDKMVILNYYHERGYIDVNILDVKITSEMNEEKQRNEMIISFIIQEGAQYTFTGLSVTGNEVFEADKLLAMNKLKEGSIYNEIKFQEGLSDIANLYYENGYMSCNFIPTVKKDPERHEVSYELAIRENRRSHIENIIIKGNGKTKDYVIRREIPIQPGDVFSRDKIINAMRSLMNLQYFSNIIPEPQQGSEEGLIDLVWTVEEQSTTQLQVGATFSGVSDPDEIPISLNAKFENSNLLGEGRSVSTGINLSTTEASLDFTYGQNWLGNLPISFQQQLSFAYSKPVIRQNMWTPLLGLNQQFYYMDYTNYSATLGTGFQRRWTPDYAILSAGWGVNNSLMNNVFNENAYVPLDQSVSAYANRWGLQNSIYTSFSIDNRDINYDPTKGWFGSEKITWVGLLPSIEREFFLRTDTVLEGYFKLLDIPLGEKYNFKLVFAASTKVSGLIPVNSVITEANRLYIDGMFNGRGWTDAYKEQKGQGMLSNNVELRIPIVPGILGIDGFWDIAAITPTMQDITKVKLDDFYGSVGPGIRFLIPQFPLHLLFAFKYRYVDNKVVWEENPFQFVLSFNLVNR